MKLNRLRKVQKALRLVREAETILSEMDFPPFALNHAAPAIRSCGDTADEIEELATVLERKHVADELWRAKHESQGDDE